MAMLGGGALIVLASVATALLVSWAVTRSAPAGMTAALVVLVASSAFLTVQVQSRDVPEALVLESADHGGWCPVTWSDPWDGQRQSAEVYCGSAIAGDYIAIRAYRFLFHDWASDPPGGSMFALAFFGTLTAGWAAFGVLDVSRRPPDWVPASSETG